MSKNKPSMNYSAYKNDKKAYKEMNHEGYAQELVFVTPNLHQEL